MNDDEIFDTVIVGSGFGGSVCAWRLAEAGQRVLVLERGQPYPPNSFARTPRALRSSFWAPDEKLYGLFELWSFTSLDALVSSGLGGGSLIYANVMLRKPEETFFDADPGDELQRAWPVSRADLEPHYDRVQAMQRPQAFPIGRGEPYSSVAKTGAMFAAANQMGLSCQLPPLAVAFAADGQPPRPGAPLGDEALNLHRAPRTTCRLCGECDLGCNYGAKQTLDFTMLSAAWRNKADLRTCCEVTELAREDRAGTIRVGYRQHVAARRGHHEDLLDPEPERLQATVRGRAVVLAAGALGTTRLLLANRARLPGLSPALGTRFSANGDALGFVRECAQRDQRGRKLHDGKGRVRWRYLNPSHGPVITASIHVPAERTLSGRAHEVQDAGAPAFSEWMWQAVEGPADAWRARALMARRLIARLRGHRQTSGSALASALLGSAHSSAAMMPLLAMGRDVPDGRLWLDERDLELDWSPEAAEQYYRDVEHSFRRVADALGGRYDRDPLERVNRQVTVHPVGGCPMDEDPRRGVADSWGRVHGQPGLYVADGSLMPGPVGPNPSFTIAALADRVADGILSPATP